MNFNRVVRRMKNILNESQEIESLGIGLNERVKDFVQKIEKAVIKAEEFYYDPNMSQLKEQNFRNLISTLKNDIQDFEQIQYRLDKFFNAYIHDELYTSEELKSILGEMGE